MLFLDNYEKLLDIAIGYNVVVFDSQAAPDQVTSRLFDLMNKQMNHDLHHVYMRMSHFPAGISSPTLTSFHLYPDKFWDKVESYYVGEAGGRTGYDSKDNNLIIGTSTDIFSANWYLFKRQSKVLVGSY
jgi:hypothetical protein